jgi:tubulysin polyketide synthase-like protein
VSVRLVSQLARRGIQVRRVGDHLAVTGPEGGLSPKALTFIRRHKEALLAALSAPPLVNPPTWPPDAVDAAVTARVAVFRDAGFSVVAAERQAAEDVLDLERRGTPAHPTVTCSFHGVPVRRLPNRELWRCPACVPSAFARRGGTVRRAA